jgi:hypothetical protein
VTRLLEEEGTMIRTLQKDRRGRVAVAAAAALAVSGGIAYASIPDAGGVVHACLLKNVGTIRVIDTAKSGLPGHCSNVETELTWNQKGEAGAPGAPGAPGAQGAQGAPGADGVSGYEVVTASEEVLGGAVWFGTVRCPAGKVATGGGFTNSPASFDTVVNASGPAFDATAWTGSVRNNGGSSVQTTVSVICIDAPA